MKTKEPVVSVVIPNHNHAPFLEDCLQSVLNQTFTDWEIIVVDDNSTDDSCGIIQRLIEEHPDHRIRLIHKKEGAIDIPAAVNDFRHPGHDRGCVLAHGGG